MYIGKNDLVIQVTLGSPINDDTQVMLLHTACTYARSKGCFVLKHSSVQITCRIAKDSFVTMKIVTLIMLGLNQC